jgi:hypothetical protein
VNPTRAGVAGVSAGAIASELPAGDYLRVAIALVACVGKCGHVVGEVPLLCV